LFDLLHYLFQLKTSLADEDTIEKKW